MLAYTAKFFAMVSQMSFANIHNKGMQKRLTILLSLNY